MTDTRPTLSLILRVVSLCGLCVVLTSCKGGQRTLEPVTNPDSSVVAMNPDHPTHKIVCECQCGSSISTERETHDVPKSDDCSDLDGIECSLPSITSKLQDCKPKSVAVE